MAAVSHYRIEFRNSSDDSLLRTVDNIPEPRLTYTNEQNAADHGGTPSRSVKVRLFTVDDLGGVSEPDEITISNPAPAAPASVSITQVGNAVDIQPELSSDPDIAGMRVWMGTSSGFTPGPGNLIYDGNSTRAVIPLSTGGTRYFRIAFFDTFSKEGLNVSGEESFSFVTQPIRDEIPPANPTAFSATALFSGAQLSWVNPADDDLAHTEVWISTTNNIADADMVQSVAAPATTISTSGQTAGSTFYYWIRSVDVWDNKSAFVGPESATVRRLVSDEIGDAIINANKLASNAVTAGKLANDAVTASKILDGAVDTAKIADAAIEAAKLGNDAVTAGKIAAGAVTGAKLASGAVSIAKFASGLRPVEIVSSLPSSGNVVGRTVVLTTDQKLYRWNGSAWTASVAAGDISGTIAAAQIAALEASKITGQLTNAQLADIAATKITGQLTNSQINDIAAAKLTGQITGTQITDGAISTGKLAAGSVTTAKLVAGAVTASEIASDAITAAKIQAGAITTAKLAAGAVTAATIAAGTITATQIQSGTITSAQIAAGTIQAGDIASNTITASQIAANAITASELSANAVTAGKIAAGAVTADEIAANAITASKIAVVNSGQNMFLDRYVKDAEYWALHGVNQVTDSVAEVAAMGVESAVEVDLSTMSATYPNVSKSFDVEPGKAYRASMKVAGTVDANRDVFIQFNFTDKDGAVIQHASGGHTYSQNFTNPVTEIVNEKVAPAGAVRCTLGFYVNNNLTEQADHGAGVGKIWFTDFFVAERIDAELIVDGAVVADKIAANAITSEKITANAITSAKIATGAITAGKIAANTITAGQIAANAIGVSELAADSVTTAKILAGAVTASEIASNAVTAAKIAAGSVSANKITSNAVTAAKILAGAVTTDKLAAASVVADKIGSAAITTDKLAANAITASKIGAGIIEGSMINSATAINVGTGGALASGLFDRAALLGEGTNSNPVRIHAGHVSPTESPFQVDREGNVIARRLTILTPDGSSVWFDTDLGFSELARAQILAQSSPRTDFLAETESTNTDFISFALVDTVNVTATAKVSSNGLSITQDWQYGQNEPGNVFPTQLSINIETAPAGGAYSDRVTKTYTKITSGSPGANEYLVEVTKQAPSQVTFIDDGVQPPQQVTYNVPGWKTERIVSPGTLSATTTNSFTGDADGETYEVRAVLSASGVNPSLLGFDSKARTIELSTPAKNFVLDLALVQGEGNAQQLQGLEPGDFWRKSELTTPLDVGTDGRLDNRTLTGSTDTATNGVFSIPYNSYIYNHNGTNLRRLIGMPSQGGDIEIGQTGTALIGGINLMPGVSGQAKVNGNEILDASGGTMTGNLSFGSATRQMINLWSTTYGIGIQNNTQYYRTANDFAWFQGGTHDEARRNPGGGTRVMHYTAGSFYVHDNEVLTVASSLNGSNITSGTVAAARIANLDASKITAGTLNSARIPNLDASKITSGEINYLRTREIQIADSRNDTIVDPLPNEFSGNRQRTDFRHTAGVANWRSVMTLGGWGGGYARHQLSFNSASSSGGTNGDLWHRDGITAWNSWRKIWDSANLPNPADYSQQMFTGTGDDTSSGARINVSTAAMNDYLIQNGSTRSTLIGRHGTGWHIDAQSSFNVFSDGWNHLFAVRGGDGNVYAKGLMSASTFFIPANGRNNYDVLSADTTTDANYGLRLAVNYDYDGWFRVVDGGGTVRFSVGRDGHAYLGLGGQGGNRIWHAGNLNPDSRPASSITSGTFADARIPGLNASKITAGTLNAARIPTVFVRDQNYRFETKEGHTIAAATTGSVPALEIYQNVAGADALIKYHISGDYAAYMGLRGSDNNWVVGGWSMGNTVAYRLLHENNAGSILNLGQYAVKNSNVTFSGLTASASFTMGTGNRRTFWDHNNDRSYMAPRLDDDTNWNWGREFGFDWTNNRWYTDGDHFAAGFVTSGRISATLRVEVPEIRTNNGTELALFAGESANVASGQNFGERVVAVAENGLQVFSSPDNWASGWAGRNGTATINDANGNSYFPGNIYATGGVFTKQGDSDLFFQQNVTGRATRIYGGTSNTDGASLIFYGVNSPFAGNAYINVGGSDTTGAFYVRHRTSTGFVNRLQVNRDGYIYGSDKEMFRTHDSWLRINNGGSFTSGVYFGNSRVRTDNEFTLNDDRYLRDGSSLSWRLQNANGYVDIGPQNSSFCHFQTDRAQFYFNKQIDASGGFEVYNSGGTRLDSEGLNLAPGDILNHNNTQSRDKIRVWSSSTYSIGMASGFTLGSLNGYAMTFQMNADSSRGFWWGDSSDASSDGAASLTTNGHYYVKSSITCGGNITQNSDRNLKHSIRPWATDFGALIDRIELKRFGWKDEEKAQDDYGVIAQEIEEVLPEVVQTQTNGTLSVDYAKIALIAVGALKQERKRNDDLERRLEHLEALV